MQLMTRVNKLTPWHTAMHYQKHSPEQREASLYTKSKGNPVMIHKSYGDFISVSHKILSSADLTKTYSELISGEMPGTYRSVTINADMINLEKFSERKHE